MMESPPALALEEVSKRFGRIHAVDRLSLQVEPGHLAGFLGPNGAGKSTTLYMIPRLVRPTNGRIRIFGVDIWKDYKRAIRSVGITVESPAFYEYLSGPEEPRTCRPFARPRFSRARLTKSWNGSAWRSGSMIACGFIRPA